MKPEDYEIILEVSDGDKQQLLGEQTPNGWVYRLHTVELVRTDSGSLKIIDEISEPIDNWETVLAFIDNKEWFLNCNPYKVHPEFREKLWQAFTARCKEKAKTSPTVDLGYKMWESLLVKGVPYDLYPYASMQPAQPDPNSPWEHIIGMATEGGSINILRRHKNTGWEFAVQRSAPAPLLLNEVEIKGLDDWQQILLLLNKKEKWHYLWPNDIHPDFREKMWSAFEEKYAQYPTPTECRDAWFLETRPDYPWNGR